MVDASDKQKQDLDDYQNELAGRSNGKQERFFVGEASRREPQDAKRREKQAQRLQTQLQIMLLDEVYRDAYDRVATFLSTVQTRLDRVLLRVTGSIERLEAVLLELENNATKLSDGSAIFRAHDGSVYTAGGKRLDSAEIMALYIASDAPSWEQYSQAREALHSARERRNVLSEIQSEKLDPVRERLNDHENPPSMDELDELEGIARDAMTELDKLERLTPSFKTEEVAATPKPDGSVELDLETIFPAP